MTTTCPTLLAKCIDDFCAKEASYLQSKPQGWAIGELVHLGSSLLMGRIVTIKDPKSLLKS